jgi:hypothetical protein
MGGERVVEPRGQPHLAQEALDGARVGAARVQHLDRRVAGEERLLGAIDGAEAAGADALDEDEVAQRPPDQRSHPRVEVSSIRPARRAIRQPGCATQAADSPTWRGTATALRDLQGGAR